MSSKSESLIIRSGFTWKFVERICIQLGKFILQILLARILLPDEYGIIAILTAFIAIADIVVQSGLNTALVQKKDCDMIDFTTVLITSFFISIIAYSLLYVLAPYIASWYQEVRLSILLRVLGINLFTGSIYSVQLAFISRKLDFKANFVSSLISIVLSGTLSVYLALTGYGIWAMVIQQVVNQAISVIVLFFYIREKPKLVFSVLRLKPLVSYGWKVMISSIIGTLNENIYNSVIGKLYSTATVGYYNRGHQFPTVLCSSANATITSVFLPVMSSRQNMKSSVKDVTRKGVQFCCFAIYPLLCGLIAISEPMVRILLTEKWLACVPFIKLECLYYMTLPIMYVQGQATKALGRSDICLVLEFCKLLLTLTSIILFRRMSIYLLLGFRIFISFSMLIIISIVNDRLINYSLREIMRDSCKSLISAFTMGAIAYTVALLHVSPYLVLLLQIICGFGSYIGLSMILKNQIIVELKNRVRRKAL